MKNDDLITFNIFGIKIKTHRDRFLFFSPFRQGPKVKNKFETLKYLLETNSSMVRFGDGEFALIKGYGLHFQEYNSMLGKRLSEILKTNDTNIIVCIPDVFKSMKSLNKKAKTFWKKYIRSNWRFIYSLLDLNKQYYDSFITRPYMDAKDKVFCKRYFDDFRQLWDKKDLIVIEGEASRLGYGNDLFSNCKSLKRILCPAKNAYDKYDEIFQFCKTLPKDKLFILALGPTATVLAYDLANLGYRTLDLGHIDIEYEWFLQGAKTKVPIKNKYVNESKDGAIVTNLNDVEYQSEIIADFSKTCSENSISV